MKDKELRRMSRSELIDMIYEMKQTEIALRQELTTLENKWNEREFRLSKVGSLAEASLALYEVIESAQKAADAYLRGVKYVCDKKEQAAQNDQK